MNPQPTKTSAWKRGHKIAIAVIGGLFALILVAMVAVALTSDGQSDEQPETEVGALPEGFDDYLADLDAINPGIRQGREDRAVFNDANNTCLSIEQGTDEDTLISSTVQRFGVNDAADIVTEDVATQILETTRGYCDIIRPE